MDGNDFKEAFTEPMPWSGRDKIPWDDPAFSERMLAVHLDQGTDLTSRRLEKVRRTCRRIHKLACKGNPCRILDLGCGPGLYASELAQMGHTVHGIDFGPASVRYARSSAPAGATFTEGDLRQVPFGADYDVLLFLFGEPDTFSVEDATRIVAKASKACNVGATLIWEVHLPETVRRVANRPPTWQKVPQGLFCAGPHLLLTRSLWHEPTQTAVEEFLVVEPGSVRRYTQCTRAVPADEWLRVFARAGCHLVQQRKGASPGFTELWFEKHAETRRVARQV